MRRPLLDDPNTLSSSSSQPLIHNRCRNVYHMLAQREISPRTKFMPKSNWGEPPKLDAESSRLKSQALRDARRGLFSWVEAESLRNLSAKYCPLVPPPRSTIAAAFSSDGKMLASTHGDHTVKIIDCQSGSCLKVLSGHRRTPWVVRFHPEHPEILASGSLDHEVRLWNSNTSECIVSRDFYRPIASIAFHAEGELIAVASGHKLYLWHYNRRGEASSPSIVLKTRRSLRAVHFHPHAAPFLLTAEVNDLDSSDSSMTRAISIGCLRYPPPAVYLTNVRCSDHLGVVGELPLMSLPFFCMPACARDDSRADLLICNRPIASSSVEAESSAAVQFQTDASAMGQQYDRTVLPVEMSPSIPSESHSAVQNTLTDNGRQSSVHGTTLDAMEATEVQLGEGCQQSISSNHAAVGGASGELPFVSRSSALPASIPRQPDRLHFEIRQQQHVSQGDPSCWELPFLQGWLMGQSQAGMNPMLPSTRGMPEYSSGHHVVDSGVFSSELVACNGEVPVASSAMQSSTSHSLVSERSGLRDHSSRTSSIPSSEFGQAAELPCTVKLKIWPHDMKNPCAPLNDEMCRLTIPHAVLCSEMGAHFSPCGRYLAACVACVLPPMEADLGLLMQHNQDITGAAMSPTRHPILARQVMYELRIYSLEDSTFGLALASRPIRAAHCLTSIQFSPTSEHLLLAYGRRHSSLLKSIVINGETSLPIYTVLEVYRVSDMELISALPSAEDEVNVACFHPLAGGGLVYGTKEGKLRILQYGGVHGVNSTGLNLFPQENMVEVE